MRFLLEQFEKHRDEGLAAYKAGDASRARQHLLRAADCLFRLAGASQGEVRDRRKASAAKLLQLASRIQPGKPLPPITAAGNAQRPAEDAKADEGDEDAKRWIVTRKPNVRFDDVAGLEDVKAVIRRRVIYPFQHPEITRRYKKKAGGGVLLYGPPGTGKTMIAKAIAAELEATFFSVKCSDIIAKWVGEAEKNLQRLFAVARACERAVVFLDETEAIVSKRGGDSTVMNRVIPEFLAQVDGLETGESTLLLLGATNRPWDMDEAALRTGRFGELIYVGLPDLPARLWMVQHALAGVPTAEDIDLDKLAQRLDGYSGADIAGLVEKAKDRPYEREIQAGQPSRLEGADIDAALAATRPSVTAAMLARYDKFRQAGQ